MIDDTAMPQPTATSNSQAARRACQLERDRVLQILGTAEDSISEPILQAIAKGTPAAIFETTQRSRAAKAQNGTGAAGSLVSGARGSKWGAITSRRNARHRAESEATNTEGSVA